jgi:hypothetical protein
VISIMMEIEPEARYGHEPPKNASRDEHPGPPFVLSWRIRKPHAASHTKATHQNVRSSSPLRLAAGANLQVGHCQLPGFLVDNRSITKRTAFGSPVIIRSLRMYLQAL